MNKTLLTILFFAVLVLFTNSLSSASGSGEFKGGIEGKEAAGAEGGVAGREIGIGAALGGVAAGQGQEGFEGGLVNISKHNIHINYKKGEVKLNYHAKLTRKIFAGGKGIRGGAGLIAGVGVGAVHAGEAAGGFKEGAAAKAREGFQANQSIENSIKEIVHKRMNSNNSDGAFSGDREFAEGGEGRAVAGREGGFGERGGFGLIGVAGLEGSQVGAEIEGGIFQEVDFDFHVEFSKGEDHFEFSDSVYHKDLVHGGKFVEAGELVAGFGAVAAEGFEGFKGGREGEAAGRIGAEGKGEFSGDKAETTSDYSKFSEHDKVRVEKAKNFVKQLTSFFDEL